MRRSSLWILGLLSKHHASHAPLRHISLSKTMNNRLALMKFVLSVLPKFFDMADYQIGQNMFEWSLYRESVDQKSDYDMRVI